MWEDTTQDMGTRRKGHWRLGWGGGVCILKDAYFTMHTSAHLQPPVNQHSFIYPSTQQTLPKGLPMAKHWARYCFSNLNLSWSPELRVQTHTNTQQSTVNKHLDFSHQCWFQAWLVMLKSFDLEHIILPLRTSIQKDNNICTAQQLHQMY